MHHVQAFVRVAGGEDPISYVRFLSIGNHFSIKINGKWKALGS